MSEESLAPAPPSGVVPDAAANPNTNETLGEGPEDPTQGSAVEQALGATDGASEAAPATLAAADAVVVPEEPNPLGPKPGMKKEELQSKANLLRKERDRLNDEARKHAEERDVFNAQVRTLVNEANEHKKHRDQLNENVKRQKEVRDEANKSAEESQRTADTLRRERMPEGDPELSVQKLKKEARALEFQQMTSVLTSSKERALVERLQEIGKMLRSKEKLLKADPELKSAMETADNLKDKAEKAHTRVGELAEKAQSEHDSMIKLYKESDKLRKKADKLQERFVTSKMEADKIHKAYIEFVNAIHVIEDQAAGQAPRLEAGASKAQREERQEAAAELVFQKFKAGEKLSTEDLLTLQKAGLL